MFSITVKHRYVSLYHCSLLSFAIVYEARWMAVTACKCFLDYWNWYVYRTPKWHDRHVRHSSGFILC